MTDIHTFLRRLSPAIVVDVETGGLDPSTAAVLEVAIGLVVDGYLTDVYSWRVVPYDAARIDPEAAALIGYTDTEDWARWGALTEAGVVAAVDSRIEAAFPGQRLTWIGHNVPFDRGCLAAAASRTGVPPIAARFGHRDIDTMAIATVAQVAGIVRSRSLNALATAAGVGRKEPGLHRADEDVRLTWAALGWLLAHLRWMT